MLSAKEFAAPARERIKAAQQPIAYTHIRGSVDQPARLLWPSRNPKGWQNVAGGRSAAKTSGIRCQKALHPEWVPDKVLMQLWIRHFTVSMITWL